MSVQEKVVSTIAEKLGKEESDIAPDKRFVEDLGADSLETVEIVMALEEEFDMEIPEEEAEKIQTVGAAIQYIEKQVG